MRFGTYVLLISLGVVACYDIYQVAKGNRNTTSRIVWDNIQSKPYIPFLAGFVMGHLFWASRLGFNICNW